MAVRILCINKADGQHENPHVGISRLGWKNEETGATGRSTRLEIYEFVKKGGDAYVVGGGSRARVLAEETATGTKYVRTRADSTRQDNLLRLPECS